MAWFYMQKVWVILSALGRLPRYAPLALVASCASIPAQGNSQRVMQVNGVTYYQASLNKPDYALVMPAGPSEQIFEVRSGDRGWGGDAANHNERSELVTKDVMRGQRKYLFPSNSDVWLSFGFQVLAGSSVSTNALVGQFHSIADPLDRGQGALLNFLLDAPSPGVLRYSLMTRSDANAISRTGAIGVRRWSRIIKMGEWINVVLRSRFDPFGNGQVQLWINGQEQINLAGIPIGYNNAVNQGYWQYGIYRNESKAPLCVAFANMEQASESLFTRVNSPLPLAMAQGPGSCGRAN